MAPRAPRGGEPHREHGVRVILELLVTGRVDTLAPARLVLRARSPVVLTCISRSFTQRLSFIQYEARLRSIDNLLASSSRVWGHELSDCVHRHKRHRVCTVVLCSRTASTVKKKTFRESNSEWAKKKKARIRRFGSRGRRPRRFRWVTKKKVVKIPTP